MSFVKEFKAFAMRGNVIDLAVGVIIAGAFGKIVSALVDNILMPIIGILMNGKNFASLQVQVGDAAIKYGMFIQSVLDFLVIAFVLFLIIRTVNNIRKKEEAVAAPPAPTTEEKLLIEIRDAIKNK